MNITLISAVSGIPTTYPTNGYGGIERIVGDLAHELQKKHFVKLVGYKNSEVGGAVSVELETESEINNYDFSDSDVVFDFSHTKAYDGDKYSIPFWSDAKGENPIFPTRAVKWSFNSDGDVILPGIDLSRYHSAKKEDYFVFLGRIAPYKGTHFATYLAKQFGFELKVAGHTGPYSSDKDYIEMIRREAGDYVEFIGDVDEEQKVELLSHSRGIIMPSNWEVLNYPILRPVESFGITAVEALACGTPVFTNDRRSGIREIVTSKTGKVYSLNEWHNITKARFRQKDILQRAKYFSVERYAKDLLEYADRGL